MLEARDSVVPVLAELRAGDGEDWGEGRMRMVQNGRSAGHLSVGAGGRGGGGGEGQRVGKVAQNGRSAVHARYIAERGEGLLNSGDGHDTGTGTLGCGYKIYIADLLCTRVSGERGGGHAMGTGFCVF